jgi:molecular chaperone HtpG
MKFFLRELISNGTDAIPKIEAPDKHWRNRRIYSIIEVKIDKEGKKLHITKAETRMTSEESREIH